MAQQNEKDSFLLGALCYFWVLSLVFLFLKKEDDFVRFHAKQGVVLFAGSFFTWVPIVGWILGVGLFLAAVAGFIKALQGEKYHLPLVFELAEKINI